MIKCEEKKSGLILEEMSPAYFYKEYLMRPAQVKVGSSNA